MPTSSPMTPATYARRLAPVVGIWATLIGGCASTTTVPTLAAGRDSASAGVAGIPNRPDLVTVIPFVQKPDLTDLEKTKAAITAEVDGRRGIFVVDLGAPDLNLNRTYLQSGATRGIDTTAAPEPDAEEQEVSEVTLRMGTMIVKIPAYLNHTWGNYTWVFEPRLGNIGLSALESFETVIDYPRRRLVLIRVDSAGRRLVDVPAYTPSWSASLVGMKWHGYRWGVRTTLNGVADSLLFDSGADENILGLASRERAGAHMTNEGTLDSLRIGDRAFAAVPFTVQDVGVGLQGPISLNMLGYPFLRSLDVVGFNPRAHKLILYRADPKSVTTR